MQSPRSSPVEILSPADTVHMASDWFEYADAGHFWVRWRADVFRRHLTGVIAPGSLFLDVGSGSGIVASQFKNEFSVEAHACDLSESYINLADSALDRRLVYNIFDRRADMVGKYDCVGAMDVIEHVPDDVGFLRAMGDHLKPSGLLALNVPALNSLSSRYDEAAGHLRRYDKRSLQAVIERAGFTDIDIWYWGFSLLPVAMCRKAYLKLSPDAEVIRRGFEPPGRVSNRLLQLLRACELKLFRSVPLGTSLFARARRK